MKLEEYDSFYHVDISTQIDNKWRNDSVLGIVKGFSKYSLKPQDLYLHNPPTLVRE